MTRTRSFTQVAGTAAVSLLVSAVAVMVALGGCSNRVVVEGGFEEVWHRSEQAMQRARFETAGTGARYERLERDRDAGTLKYVWSDGGFFDARVVTLTISPGAADPEPKREIRIDAWTWGFFGWARISDAQATQEAYNALRAEFERPPDQAPDDGGA